MTQTSPGPAQPAQTPPARKTRRLVLIVGVLIVLLLLLIIGTCDNSPDADQPAAPPAPAQSSAPADEQPTPTPEPSETPESAPEDTNPDSDTILTYLAESAGAATPDEACTNGISWLCAIDYVNANGGVLEVRVDNTENAEGDAIARSFYNFLTASDDSPMPDVFFVQVTTAADGEVGGFRNY